MDISKELLRLLMEIAILNYDKGFANEAEQIFEAIAFCRPQSGYPCIGRACVQMYRGNYESAIVTLQNAPYEDFMQEELGKSYLGKALKLAGYNDEARNILKEIEEHGRYEVAVNFARELLSVDLT